MNNKLLSPAKLEARLRKVGQEKYHHQHPFHLLMHEGKLSRGQIQAWVLNRYYYQSIIPIKDNIIISRSDDPSFQKSWQKRVTDHKGFGGDPGGVEKWLQLAEAAGLDRKRVIQCNEILPITRFAVNGYLDLVEKKTFLEAVASSLTEMFSHVLITLRIDKLQTHYPWLNKGLAYFEARLSQAPEDAAFALDWVTRHALTRSDQELAIQALTTKCEILWAQLDGLYYSYVNPGWPPPGTFQPEKDE